MMNPITVLGASGFIGSALVKRLQQIGATFFAPGKDERLRGRPLGSVIYCIGLTADFRSRPFETVEAHVCYLWDVLRKCDFDSLTYLSSARVYQGHGAPAREENPIQVSSWQLDELYNISKLMGESLALGCGRKTTVVRLSNVYGVDFGSPNFLSAIVTEAITTGKVIVRSAPKAEKDYVCIHDVVDVLLKIVAGARESVYNLASGVNVSNQALTAKISELTGCDILFDPMAEEKTFPLISVDRIRSEFGFRPRLILDDLGELIDSYRQHYRTAAVNGGRRQ